MGKGPFSFRRSSSRRRTKKPEEFPLLPPPLPTSPSPVVVATNNKTKKKAGGARLWMRFDLSGQSELFECDKSVIIKRVCIPARDLRILGPVFSHSSNILAREKAMVVNLEFIKAIVTAEEVLLLDPLRQEVLPFVDQLKHQLPHKSPTSNTHGERQLAVRDTEAGEELQAELPFEFQVLEIAHGECQLALRDTEAGEELQAELPFEFQVLEIALEVVCRYLDSSVADLEKDAYPVLDELAKDVSTKNLEHVRSLKSHLTKLLARVQKVRDEIEHLLDDNEDMAQLYLTRKWIQNQQYEALLGVAATNSITTAHNLQRLSSVRSGSLLTSNHFNDNDVEDLEMLLDAYFMQLDGTRNKILSVREYIADTEDYVNIHQDNKRNQLIQLQLTLTIASFSVAVGTMIAGWFGMNIPCNLYQIDGIFWPFVGGLIGGCILLFLLVLGYARRKKLLGS